MGAQILDCRGLKLELGRQVRFMGILNVTPDSFFDGGRRADTEAAVKHGVSLAGEGASFIDVGGQSTRPGFTEISADEEMRRILPVIEKLAVAAPQVSISVDTYKAGVARAAMKAGAHLLNDIHGFQGDPEMAGVAAEFGCPVVLMHLERGFSREEGEVIGRLKRYFERSLERAAAAGVGEERTILDPGIGFFKTPEQSLEIVGRIGELKSLGRPLLLGASRKSFIGHVLGGGPEERLEGTIATSVWAALNGVDILRVHDLRANLRAVRMAEAVLQTFSQAFSATGSRPSSKSM